MSRIFEAQCRVFLACLLAMGVGACAGGSLKRLDDGLEIPAELAKDLDQFTVKTEVREEAPAPAPAVQPQALPGPVRVAPVQAPVVRKSRKKKNGFAYPVRRPGFDPIRLGERQVFQVSYLGMTAGEFDLSVQPFKEINQRRVYHVQGKARSASLFSLFYRLNDTIETYIDFEGIFPHRFHILLDESKQTRNSLELYDAEKQQTFYWSRWNHHKRGFSEIKKFFPLVPYSQDSLSALFYLRTLPLTEGSVETFPVISEGKNWDAVVTVVGREKIDSPWGRVQAVKLKLETKYQGILKKQGDTHNHIWLTDDDRRFLVKLEAKVKIGTIIGRLVRVEPGQPTTPALLELRAGADELVPPSPSPTALPLGTRLDEVRPEK